MFPLIIVYCCLFVSYIGWVALPKGDPPFGVVGRDSGVGSGSGVGQGAGNAHVGAVVGVR